MTIGDKGWLISGETAEQEGRVHGDLGRWEWLTFADHFLPPFRVLLTCILFFSDINPAFPFYS